MPLAVFLASDVHLGMKFASSPEAARARLVEERFACLERVVASAASADLLVIAGDLFDSPRAALRDVQRAARALSAFAGRLVAVLPGNHDYLAPGDPLWQRFREAAGDRVLLMEEPRPYPLAGFDVDACLYPGPCTAKHSARDAVGWIRGAARDPSSRFHVGVAHGSVDGFTPDTDGRYYPMRLPDLDALGLDLWLLGHTHVRSPAGAGAGGRVFWAGAPEPDGFDFAGDGTAWAIELADDRGVRSRVVPTGGLRFVVDEREVRSAADLEAAERAHAGPSAGATLLRLVLRGRAPADVVASVGALEARLRGSLLSAEVRAGDLREEITPAAIDREYPAGSFPHALLRRLAEAGDEAGLVMAHAILGELRR